MLTSAKTKVCSAALAATVVLTVAIMAGGPAKAAGSQFCKLDKMGNGSRTCQCYVLQNRLAKPRVLQRLETMAVCPASYTSFSGGGGSGFTVPVGQPTVPQDTPDHEPVCNSGYGAKPQSSDSGS